MSTYIRNICARPGCPTCGGQALINGGAIDLRATGNDSLGRPTGDHKSDGTQDVRRARREFWRSIIYLVRMLCK